MPPHHLKVSIFVLHIRMKQFLNLLFLLILSGWINAQKYSLYTDDTLVLNSKYLQDEITLNLHLPETFYFSAAQTTYPLAIIFDSQHERTYPHLIHSFDMLTSETQTPETIIVGVPFTIENRYYFTSNQKKIGDSLSGIEKMELFLFNELIPQLKKEKKVNDHLSVYGHSRTGFLVNYLTFKRSKEINVAASLSGFFSEPPLSIPSFAEFILKPNNFSKKFSYFATSGSTLEEITYSKQYLEVFGKTPFSLDSPLLKIRFKQNEHANHITNYWLSISEIIIDTYSDYNQILDTWFHNKLKDSEKPSNPIQQFTSDLQEAGKKLGFEINPSITHIFSLMSHYGYQNKEYKTAIDFLNLGLKYYPDYIEFYVELIEFYTLLEDSEKVKEYRNQLKSILGLNKRISEKLRIEVQEYLNSN